MGTFAGLGIHPEIYWMSELYGDGSMDPYIRTALDRAEVIRDIYLRVSNVERPAGLAAGRRSSARSAAGSARRSRPTGTARPSPTPASPTTSQWAHGLRQQRARGAVRWAAPSCPFNVDWAAKWSHFDVTVEGCGKDLATKGGSRDRSDAVSREVYEREPPLNVAYEFLNIGGRKMSTSKGSGAAAHEMADLLPPELLRFLFLRHKPRRAHRVRPRGRRDPRALRRVRPGGRGDRRASPSAASCRPTRSASSRPASSMPARIPATEAARYRPPFRHLALLVQVPGVDLEARFAAEKGAPLDEAERAILERARRASRRTWLEGFAPERYRVAVLDELPDLAAGLTEAQALFLADLADRRPRGAAERRATRGRTSSTAPRSGAASRRATRSRRCTRPSSGARTGRAPAGCSRASTEELRRLRASSRSGRRRPRHRSGWTGGGRSHERRRRPAARASPTSSAPAPSRRARTRRSSTRRSSPMSGGATCWARPTPCAPSASASPSRSAWRSAAGPTPEGPEVAALREQFDVRSAPRSTSSMPQVARLHGRARGAAAAHPQPARPGHARGRRGGERHRADVGRAGCPRGAAGWRPARPGRAGRTGRSPRPWA